MRAIIFLLSSLTFVPAAFAHTDGLSFERKVDDILIDIGFGKDMPVAGSTLTYSFDLFNVADENKYLFEPFSDVHVRIFNGRQEVLSRTLQNNGTDVPSLSFQYREAGDYSLAAIYERTGKDPVQSTFGYRVNEAPAPDTADLARKNGLLAALAVVLMLGVGAMMIFGKKD